MTDRKIGKIVNINANIDGRRPRNRGAKEQAGIMRTLLEAHTKKNITEAGIPMTKTATEAI
jgi:hypothetical protein